MKFVLITKDQGMEDAARKGFSRSDEILVFPDWEPALNACDGADLLFVDLIATLTTPHKIAGYEAFGTAKMEHPIAATTPLVLLSPEVDYDLDFIVGWEGFVLANVQRPVNQAKFRRAATWA